jgi:hypothetical protein
VGHFGSDPTDEELSFDNFIVAFDGLLGHDGLIPDAEMAKFTAFMLAVVPPPNPIRPLDNRLVGDALLGSNRFGAPQTDSGVLACNDCHVVAPASGFFGANGTRSFQQEPQHFKVPHLRNVYAKVGMFGMPRVDFLAGGDNGHQGPQIRGFGMLHDGSVDTVFRFLGATPFTLTDTDRRHLEQFMFEFPSDYAPIVGQQATLTAASGGTVGPRIDLLIERAHACFELLDVPGASECDLVVKGNVAGQARGWLGELEGGCGPAQPLLFRSDRRSDPVLTDLQLRTLATGDATLTYTCAPPGSGRRMALDHDEDGHFDRDELDAGTDPADPLSTPPTVATGTPVTTRKILIRDSADDREDRRKVVILSKDEGIVVPAPGSGGDPTCNGDPPGTVKASLTVSSSASGEVHRASLPCENWALLGSPSAPKGYRYRDAPLDDGTVKTALWKPGKLRLVAQGKGAFFLDYDLVAGVSQDTVDAVLVNDGGNVCMACPPYGGQDGSDANRFSGRSCAPPGVCGAT